MKLLPNTKFSKPFKKFVRTTINQNYNQKGGFLFMKINNVDSKIINFALQNLNEKTSVTVVDFNKDRNTESIIVSFTFNLLFIKLEFPVQFKALHIRDCRSRKRYVIHKQIILQYENFKSSYSFTFHWKDTFIDC